MSFLFYLFEVTATLHINYPMKIRIDIEAEVRSFGFPIPILEKKVDLLETIINFWPPDLFIFISFIS